MREKRTKGTHQITTDPYGQARNKIMGARQAAYGAAGPSQDAAASKRKRPAKSRKKSAKPATNEESDVELPSASSSLENSPAEKEPRVEEPVGSLSPTGPRVQTSGRRLASL